MPSLPSTEDPAVKAASPWPCAGFPFASPGGDDSISHTTASRLTKSVPTPDTVCAAHAPYPVLTILTVEETAESSVTFTRPHSRYSVRSTVRTRLTFPHVSVTFTRPHSWYSGPRRGPAFHSLMSTRHRGTGTLRLLSGFKHRCIPLLARVWG